MLRFFFRFFLGLFRLSINNLSKNRVTTGTNTGSRVVAVTPGRAVPAGVEGAKASLCTVGQSEGTLNGKKTGKKRPWHVFFVFFPSVFFCWWVGGGFSCCFMF